MNDTSNKKWRLLYFVAKQGKYTLTDNAFLLEQFYYHCRIKNLRPKTLDCYAERLTYFMYWLNKQEDCGGHCPLAGSCHHTLDKIDIVCIQQYIMSLIEPNKVSAETINGRIRVYKLFYRFLFENGLIKKNPLEKIKLLKVDRKIKTVVSPQQLSLALKYFNQQSFCGSRNRLMILMTYDTMIRSGELINLETSNVDLGSKLIKVHGKSRRDRVIPMSVKTAKCAQRYSLRWRSSRPGDRFFCKKGGEALDVYRVYKIFREAGKKIGVLMGPHLIRHSGANEYTRLGGHVEVLQLLLGHSDIRTTMIYQHKKVDDMIEGHKRFSPVELMEV